jgi:predicted Zn-dependent protease
MKDFFWSYKGVLTALFVIYLAASCATVPVSGRKQLRLVSSSQIMSMSGTSYREFLRSNQVITGTAEAQTVTEVGRKIQAAVESYMQQNNLSDKLRNFAWEYNLVADNSINAWCMPGGKVVVYTGILPVCVDEAGLAVVMGHEIAHAVAEHGNERMSQQLLVNGLLAAGEIALSVQRNPKLTHQIALLAAGAGSQLGLLAFSRKHESEADELGLIFMAMAGYDPNEAPKFWDRMQKASGSGRGTPEFLSTHPSHGTRIENLNKLIPKAMTYYKKN